MTYQDYTEKRCCTCGITKPIIDFCKVKTRKDGRQTSCRNCAKINIANYRKTKKGVITTIYNSQRLNSKKRGHAPPKYTGIDLRKWMFCNPVFDEIYVKWVNSGYSKKLKPSCDRIDDYKSYTFDNIQIVTWQENNAKSHSDRRNGINNKASKAVIQKSMNGEFIYKFHSVHCASRVTGFLMSSIAKCCRKERRSLHGYKWSFA